MVPEWKWTVVYRSIPKSLSFHKMLHFYHNIRSECWYCGIFPKQIDFIVVKIDDFITKSAEDIIEIIANPPAPTIPSLEAGDETKNALLILA